MPRPSSKPSVLTVPEVAKRLRIGRTSAYQLCARPDFPALRVGGQIRVAEDALQRWLLGAAEGKTSK